MARNLTPTHTIHDSGGSVTTTEPEKTKRVRKQIGPGAAVDRVLRLRDSFEDEALEAMDALQEKLNDRRLARETDILSHCTDPEAARKMLKAREGE